MGSKSSETAGRVGWIDLNAWLLRLLSLVLLPGCSLLEAPEKVVTAVVPVERGRRADPIDLQVQVQRFADDYASRTASAIDECVQRVGTEAARVQGLKWKLAAATAAISIASGPQPKANLLDLVSLAVLNAGAVEDLQRNDTFGRAYEPWLRASQALASNAWDLAAARLPPEHVAEFREALEQWEARNPSVRNLFAARPQEFGSLEKLAPPRQTDVNSVFSLVGLDPAAGLDPAVREVTLTRLFAERGLYVLQRMPALLRWQTELLGSDLAGQPGVQTVLSNTTRLSESMERISRAADSASQTAAELPDRIATERQAVLAALEHQEGKLRELAVTVDRSLVSGAKMSDALNVAITTFDGLMKRFGVGEPKTNAPPGTNSPPFSILDYAKTAEQVGAMAKDLNTLIASVNQSVPQFERLSQQATAEAQRAVDRAFRLGLVLIVVLLVGAVLAGLVYRGLADRLTRAGAAPPGPPSRPGIV